MYTFRCLIFSGALMGACAGSQAEMDTVRNEHPNVGETIYSAPTAAVEAWKDDRMGLFIHWDPGSQEGHETSWARRNPKVDEAHYDNLYKTFNPEKYDPDAIVELAYAAGARYVVMIAKHHAGFSMFDSNVTEFDMMSTPYNKDVLKMMEQACRRKGMKFGFYYSPVDWTHPAFGTKKHDPEYNDFYVAQLTELLTNYGDIHSVWFDGAHGGRWGDTLETVAELIREKQPHALMNDRSGYKGDYYTTEHSIGPRNLDVTWETCQTTSYGTWGYIKNNSPGKPFSYLLELAAYAWGRDGNFLLNLGPSGEGIFTDSGVVTWTQFGEWMSVHGEAVHGTRAGPYIDAEWGVSTARENTVYLYVYTWEKDGIRFFPNLTGRTVRDARLLGGGQTTFAVAEGGFTLTKPDTAEEGLPSVIAVSFDGPVVHADAVLVQEELSYASALNPGGPEPKALFDGNTATEWVISEDALTLEVDFGRTVNISSYLMERGVTWSAKTQWTLSVEKPDGRWEELPSNLPIPNIAKKRLWSLNKGAPIQRFHSPVQAKRIRFNFVSSPGRKIFLNELKFYGEEK